MTTLELKRLSDTVGAEIVGVDAERLSNDDAVSARIPDVLALHGALVFRGLHLEPQQQVAFSRRLGEIDESEGHHPVRGIYRVTLDRSKNPSAEYLQGTFDWHIDG